VIGFFDYENVLLKFDDIWHKWNKNAILDDLKGIKVNRVDFDWDFVFLLHNETLI